MVRVEQDGIVFYQFEQWQDAGLRHGVFTRLGGVSQPPFDSLNMGGNVGDDPAHVRRNHERMFQALGARDETACSVWQVHSARVLVAEGPARGRRWITSADAMITDRPDTPLTMRFADCTPILLLDRSAGVIGMAHAGWRGTVQRVCREAVRAMQRQYGCRAHDIEAGIGPAIGLARYEVGEEVVEQVMAAYGDDGATQCISRVNGRAHLDLWRANALDLQRAGVERIETAGICTAENTHEFFSHRAERGKTGRFGAVISL